MSAASAARVTLYERLQMFGLPSLQRVAQRLPPRLGVALLVAVGAGQALVDPRRLKRAVVWAAANRRGPRARASCLLSLLANRGRFLAWAMGIGVADPEALRRTIVIEGQAVLDRAAAAGGVLLVSFHLGPSTTAFVLTLSGYRLVVGIGGARHAAPRLPDSWRDAPQPTYVRLRDTASRAAGLYELVRRLQDGSIVVLAADGFGRQEFSVPLPGRDMRVRSGWYSLRRLTGAPTFPVLHHWSQGQHIIQIHPPLPPPEADLERDRQVCQAQLTGVLRGFVQAYPEQCVSLAFRPDRVEDPA
jgi:lauroyl/myristoyl acyltransferase